MLNLINAYHFPLRGVVQFNIQSTMAPNVYMTNILAGAAAPYQSVIFESLSSIGTNYILQFKNTDPTDMILFLLKNTIAETNMLLSMAQSMPQIAVGAPQYALSSSSNSSSSLNSSSSSSLPQVTSSAESKPVVNAVESKPTADNTNEAVPSSKKQKTALDNAPDEQLSLSRGERKRQDRKTLDDMFAQIESVLRDKDDDSQVVYAPPKEKPSKRVLLSYCLDKFSLDKQWKKGAKDKISQLEAENKRLREIMSAQQEQKVPEVSSGSGLTASLSDCSSTGAVKSSSTLSDFSGAFFSSSSNSSSQAAAVSSLQHSGTQAANDDSTKGSKRTSSQL